jgi:hypothetical protein
MEEAQLRQRQRERRLAQQRQRGSVLRCCVAQRRQQLLDLRVCGV